MVVNLYPFASDPSIELIDIGGPAMVRAAAKNHAHVGVVVDPSDYDEVVAEITAHGALSHAFRRRLARTAFARTAAYDAEIVAWLDGEDEGADAALPETIHLSATRAQSLRYGENPHQVGARYTFGDSCWDTAVQHQGKEMSYLNVYDADAAWRLVWSLGDRPAAVVIKHANPCGAAVDDDITVAYQRAHECDPVSAYGGIVALNRPMPVALAEALAPVFTEVVVAPAYEDGALEVLAAKKNLRVLTARPPVVPDLDVRSIEGGLLVQTRDVVSMDRVGVDRRDRPRPDRRRVARHGARLEDRGAGHVEHDRAGQGRPGGRDRRRPTEPRRCRSHRGGEGGRSCQGRGVRIRCVLPVP